MEFLRSGLASKRLTAVALMCALYAVSFAFFYPRLPINIDEAEYIRQAQLLLQGESGAERIDPLSGLPRPVRVSTYPVGTAALLAPAVALAGAAGAYLVPMLCLLAAVLLTARWLVEEGRSPLFAILILGFPPALVMGRVAMSDVPSMLLVVFGFWLFWRGLERGWGWWLAAGFVAGGSAAFRPTNVIMFVPLFAGTVLRRERKALALIVGGLAGTCLRLASSAFVLGGPFAARTGYRFAPDTLMDRLPLFAAGLLIFVPGGLLLAMAYKGRRRAEIVATPALFFGFYLFQFYSYEEGAGSRRFVLALRYFLPLLPVMAFAMAESVPRLWNAWSAARGPERSARWSGFAAVAAGLWLLGVAAASAAVHPVMSKWSEALAEVRDEIEQRVPKDAVLIVNAAGTRKFVNPIERTYAPIKRRSLEPGDLERLVRDFPDVFVVILDRSDSAWWRAEREKNAAFIAGLPEPHTLLTDRHVTATDHLRIWRLGVFEPSDL